MLEYTDKIREIARRLLKECQVDMVIGFQKGTMPMMNEPCFIKRPEDVDRLVWDSNCGINLANYLTDRKEKIGVVAKGCDSRNIVTHIIENKIKRDQLYIIGVPCKGMIDKRQITAAYEGEITEVTEKDGSIVIKGRGFDGVLKKADVMQENCAVCTHRNPVIYDELVADPVAEQTDVDRYADVRAIEALTLKKSGIISRTCWRPASAAMPAAMPARCATAPPVLWTSRVPSGWEKARTPSTCAPSIFCGPTTAPGAARTAAPVSGPARWGSTCGCLPRSLKRTASICSDGRPGRPGRTAAAGHLSPR